MHLRESYGYLARARRDLWVALEGAPVELLTRPMLDGSRFHCIQDLVFHVACVEDGWLHEDILREETVLTRFAALEKTRGGPEYAGFAIGELLEYWRAVEESTLRYLDEMSEAELRRVVTVHDAPEERYTVEGLLWHVMIHEMRHTAQIAMLLRMQGIQPPSLDLLFYLKRE